MFLIHPPAPLLPVPADLYRQIAQRKRWGGDQDKLPVECLFKQVTVFPAAEKLEADPQEALVANLPLGNMPFIPDPLWTLLSNGAGV